MRLHSSPYSSWFDLQFCASLRFAPRALSRAVRPSPADRYLRSRQRRLCLFDWHRRPASHVPYELSPLTRSPGSLSVWGHHRSPAGGTTSGKFTASPNLVSSQLLESFNAKGNVDANSPSNADRCSSRHFSIISRSASGRSVWSSLRQRQMSFRTDLISLKLSSIVVIADPNVIQS